MGTVGRRKGLFSVPSIRETVFSRKFGKNPFFSSVTVPFTGKHTWHCRLLSSPVKIRPIREIRLIRGKPEPFQHESSEKREGNRIAPMKSVVKNLTSRHFGDIIFH